MVMYEGEEMDPTDYAVLKYLGDVDPGAWKSKLHAGLADDPGRYPFFTGAAVQTVGRHVDRLQDLGLVAASMVTAENMERKFIIGFKLTAEGREALDGVRRQFLREIVTEMGAAVEGLDTVGITKDALIGLLTDEFDCSLACTELMRSEMTERSLLLVLAMYSFRQNMQALEDEQLEPGQTACMRRLIEDVPRLAAVFNRQDSFEPAEEDPADEEVISEDTGLWAPR